MNIHSLFPTPVGVTDISKIPIHEHEELLALPFKTHKSYPMTVSESGRILDSHAPTIRKFIQRELDIFSQNTLGTYEKLKISQSWLTKHDPGIAQKTMPHYHQNSVISGVYYLRATEQDEGLTFFKDNELTNKFLLWEKNEELRDNSRWAYDWKKFPVKSGTLILFPSALRHAVLGSLSPNLRCALGFSTWFENPIGDEELFTKIQ